ncbi:hypothetical protein B5S30_g2871 [[Candida] boidinii]|nr:hypothetical protein B5S30_g2871 [[Candida] boidinii]GMF97923.1 unnamed protein product [[Candida] boidinii]
MSRLIVKNLPINFTEEKLREHFGKQGSVTDVKLMKKRNGESRRFAFIGYKTVQEAESAVKYFNRSFINTSKLDVQLAKTFSDPTVPKSWKQKEREHQDILTKAERELERLEAEQKQSRQNKKQKKSNSEIDSKIENDSKLREFMEVMKPSSQVKSWANDAVVSDQKIDVVNSNNEDNSNFIIPENESDDEYEEFKSTKIEKDNDEEKGNGQEEKMVSLSDFNNNEDAEEEEGENTQGKHENEDKPDENMSDLDWFKMRRTRMKDNNGDESKEISNEKEESLEVEKKTKHEPQTQVVNQEEKEAPQEPKEEEPEEPTEYSNTEVIAQKIMQTSRLFIRNILYTATEEEFRELFSRFGDLKEVHIAIDTRTGTSKGFCYIEFKNSEDAVDAFRTLDKQIFQGRLLHILPGEPKKDHRLDEFDIKNMPLKKQRLLKKKSEASNSQFSWNSLYMNTDAVLDSVAFKLGISKSELINPENSGSAVKQALAEAHVIGDVRRYFEDKKVDLTTFNSKERDDKIILVKNFSFGTTKEELGELFSTYGQLKRLLMPPAGTIAIVEFRDAPSARSAFSKLAYRRLGKSILYLEKGPKGLFTGEPSNDDANELNGITSEKEIDLKEAKISSSDVMEGESKEVVDNDKGDEEDDDEDDGEDSFVGPTVSIFVKNLNFQTTTAALRDAFKKLSGFIVATIKTKPDPKVSGRVLSMGFGFVEFKTKEQANTAISIMDGYALDGHKLQLKLSNRKSDNNSSGSGNNANSNKKAKSSKIIVKNLPFEATRMDIFELFSSFGRLKSVRVPKKFDKSARGFAFIEFSLNKEAENAMDQLQGVHLLGRRLVLQYAEEDPKNVEEEIEKMTNKAKRQVGARKMADLREVNSGKRKLELEEEDEF